MTAPRHSLTAAIQGGAVVPFHGGLSFASTASRIREIISPGHAEQERHDKRKIDRMSPAAMTVSVTH